MVTNSILDTGDLEVKGKTKLVKGLETDDITASQVDSNGVDAANVTAEQVNTDNISVTGETKVNTIEAEGNITSEGDIYAENFYGSKSDSQIKFVYTSTPDSRYSILDRNHLYIKAGTVSAEVNYGYLSVISSNISAVYSPDHITFTSQVGYKLNFPKKSGTFAVTSDVDSVSDEVDAVKESLSGYQTKLDLVNVTRHNVVVSGIGTYANASVDFRITFSVVSQTTNYTSISSLTGLIVTPSGVYIKGTSASDYSQAFVAVVSFKSATAITLLALDETTEQDITITSCTVTDYSPITVGYASKESS